MFTGGHGVDHDTDHDPGEVFHGLINVSEQTKENDTQESTYSAEAGAVSEVEQKSWRGSRHFGTPA